MLGEAYGVDSTVKVLAQIDCEVMLFPDTRILLPGLQAHPNIPDSFLSFTSSWAELGTAYVIGQAMASMSLSAKVDGSNGKLRTYEQFMEDSFRVSLPSVSRPLGYIGCFVESKESKGGHEPATAWGETFDTDGFNRYLLTRL